MSAMISDRVISAIRTYVPLGVGAGAAWLAVHFGIVVDDQTEAAIAVPLTAALGAGYWSLVRVLEHRWPKLGWLLGVAAKPTYKTTRRRRNQIAHRG